MSGGQRLKKKVFITPMKEGEGSKIKAKPSKLKGEREAQ